MAQNRSRTTQSGGQGSRDAPAKLAMTCRLASAASWNCPRRQSSSIWATPAFDRCCPGVFASPSSRCWPSAMMEPLGVLGRTGLGESRGLIRHVTLRARRWAQHANPGDEGPAFFDRQEACGRQGPLSSKGSKAPQQRLPDPKPESFAYCGALAAFDGVIACWLAQPSITRRQHSRCVRHGCSTRRPGTDCWADGTVVQADCQPMGPARCAHGRWGLVGS